MQPTTAAACPEVGELMTSSIKNVFSTMLAIDLETALEEAKPWVTTEETVASAVGLAGPSQGAVCLQMSQVLARISASTMLGVPADTLADMEVNDVVGELTNMVAGDLKSKLGEANSACQLTVPTVIRGRGLQITTLDRRESCHYERVYQTGPHLVGLLVALKSR